MRHIDLLGAGDRQAGARGERDSSGVGKAPYVRRQKNDQGDAAAICEAVSRPSMRFVAIKTIEQQATSELRTRAATASYAARDREIYQMRITAGTPQGKRALRFR